MKTITYRTKPGGAAIYWIITREEQQWIIDQLERLQIEVNERSISTIAQDQNLKEYWNTPNLDLGYSPKHKQRNTAASVIGGILRNLKLGHTRDFTDKICEKIQTIFDDIESGTQQQLLPDMRIESVKFTKTIQRESNELFEFV